MNKPACVVVAVVCLVSSIFIWNTDNTLGFSTQQIIKETCLSALSAAGLSPATNASNITRSASENATSLGSEACGPKSGLVYVRYVPSPLELSWNASIAKISKDWFRIGCPKVKEDVPKYGKWFAAAVSTKPAEIVGNEEAMSYHVYRDSCNGDKLIKIPIEPIMGILRHPAALCMSSPKDSTNDLMRKDWLILPNAEYFLDVARKPSKVIFYDLGASTYKTGVGGSSQEWFVDEFSKRNMEFDDVFAWEATKHDDAEIFKDMPPSMLHKVRYYNVPVELDPKALHNPIRLLKASARPEDYVVIKLDIDTSWLEVGLIKQLLGDPDAFRLVDELFFEHHTLGNPMVHFWRGSAQQDITDSYSLFTELRTKGIRAHSWV
jgi:hypothetical protein